jgi:hypothetical protein
MLLVQTFRNIYLRVIGYSTQSKILQDIVEMAPWLSSYPRWIPRPMGNKLCFSEEPSRADYLPCNAFPVFGFRYSTLDTDNYIQHQKDSKNACAKCAALVPDSSIMSGQKSINNERPTYNRPAHTLTLQRVRLIKSFSLTLKPGKPTQKKGLWPSTQK